MNEHVVFGQTFEGLYKNALRGRLSPTIKEQLRGIGLDVDRPFLAGYPIDIWKRGIEILAPALYPELGFEEATWRLGEDFINGYAHTAMGRAMFGVLKLIGPMNGLKRMERNLRSGNNFVSTRFTQLGPTAAELWWSEVHGLPGFTGGFVLGGGKLVGAKNFAVQIAATEGGSCTYRVSWDG